MRFPQAVVDVRARHTAVAGLEARMAVTPMHARARPAARRMRSVAVVRPVVTNIDLFVAVHSLPTSRTCAVVAVEQIRARGVIRTGDAEAIVDVPIAVLPLPTHLAEAHVVGHDVNTLARVLARVARALVELLLAVDPSVSRPRASVVSAGAVVPIGLEAVP